MGLQATHLHIRRCNLKSSQLLLLLTHLSPPGAGVGVGGVSEQAQQPGEGRREPQPLEPPGPLQSQREGHLRIRGPSPDPLLS